MIINLINLDENPGQETPKTKPDLVLSYSHGAWLTENEKENKDLNCTEDLMFTVSLHKKAKGKNATIVYGEDEAKVWFTEA